eukprot:1986874-Rhodomonas_salina.1
MACTRILTLQLCSSPCPDCGAGRFASGCTGREPGQCTDCPACPQESYRCERAKPELRLEA